MSLINRNFIAINLKELLGKNIKILMHNDVIFFGKLKKFDRVTNLILEDVKCIIDDNKIFYNETILKGNYISSIEECSGDNIQNINN